MGTTVEVLDSSGPPDSLSFGRGVVWGHDGSQAHVYFKNGQALLRVASSAVRELEGTGPTTSRTPSPPSDIARVVLSALLDDESWQSELLGEPTLPGYLVIQAGQVIEVWFEPQVPWSTIRSQLKRAGRPREGWFTRGRSRTGRDTHSVS